MKERETISHTIPDLDLNKLPITERNYDEKIDVVKIMENLQVENNIVAKIKETKDFAGHDH